LVANQLRQLVTLEARRDALADLVSTQAVEVNGRFLILVTRSS
jgi:hypothetical protein